MQRKTEPEHCVRNGMEVFRGNAESNRFVGRTVICPPIKWYSSIKIEEI